VVSSIEIEFVTGVLACLQAIAVAQLPTSKRLLMTTESDRGSCLTCRSSTGRFAVCWRSAHC